MKQKYMSAIVSKTPIIVQFLVVLLLSYHLFVKIFKIPGQNYLSALIALITCILTYAYYRKEFKTIEFFIAAYMALLIIWTSITQDFSLIRTWNYYIFLIAYCFGIVTAYSGLNRKLFIFLYVFITSVIIYGFTFGGIDFNTFNRFVHMNRNGISLLQLIGVSLVYLSYNEYQRKKPAIWPSILALLVTFLSKSRAGIFLSSLLFLGVIALNIKAMIMLNTTVKSLSRKKKALIISFILFLAFFILYQIFINSRFSQYGFSSSGRYEIVAMFIDKLTWSNFIFGFYPDSMSVKFDDFHNSYLQLISYVGIASLPVFASLLWSLIKLRKDYLLFLLLAIFSLYSLVEYRIFINLADFVLFPSFMIAIKKSRAKHDASF